MIPAERNVVLKALGLRQYGNTDVWSRYTKVWAIQWCDGKIEVFHCDRTKLKGWYDTVTGKCEYPAWIKHIIKVIKERMIV